MTIQIQTVSCFLSKYNRKQKKNNKYLRIFLKKIDNPTNINKNIANVLYANAGRS